METTARPIEMNLVIDNKYKIPICINEPLEKMDGYKLWSYIHHEIGFVTADHLKISYDDTKIPNCGVTNPFSKNGTIMHVTDIVAKSNHKLYPFHYIPGYFSIHGTEEDLEKWIQTWLALGFDINDKNEDGVLIATSAIKFCKGAELLKIFIKHGLDINTKNTFGSALHREIRHNNMDFAELLMENKIDLEIRDNNGMTAAELAASYDDDIYDRYNKFMELVKKHYGE